MSRDRANHTSTSWAAGCVQVVIGMAVGGAVLWQVIHYHARDPNYSSLATWLTVAAAFVLAILTHEIGHAAAAVGVGFTVLRVQLWRLTLQRDGPGRPWRPKFGPNVPTASVATLPRDTADLCRRFALLVAAGPGASAVAAVAALGLSLCLPPTSAIFRLGGPASWGEGWGLLFPSTWRAFALNIYAVFNLLFTAITLYPSGGNGFPTDGEHLRRLRHPEYEVDIVVGWLSELTRGGARPREWPPHLTAYLDRPAHADKAMAHLFAYYLAEDTGDVERAGLEGGY